MAIVRKDEKFSGYVETEAIPEIWISRDQSIAPYQSGDANFPLPKRELVTANKGADVHVFRDVTLALDELDEELEEIGCYRVDTERGRIWTLLLASTADARVAISRLGAHFKKTGGVYKVEAEVVTGLHLFPKNFQMGQVVPRGAYANL